MVNDLRTLNVSYRHISKAITDPDYRLALSLNVLIHAHSVSSVIKNATLRELKKSFRLSADTLRKAIKTGIDNGLFLFFEHKGKSNKKTKYLRALPIKERGTVNTRLQICDSPVGKQIYLASTVKDNFIKYSQLTTPISLASVSELFIISKLDKQIKGYWKGRDQEFKRRLADRGSKNLINRCKSFNSMRRLEQDILDGSKVDCYDWLNTGYGLRRMSEKCGGRNTTLYLIRKCIHRAIEDGLFSVLTNQVCVRNEGNAIHRHWKDDLGVPLPDKNSPRFAMEVFEYVEKQEKAIKRQKAWKYDNIYRNPYTGELEDLSIRAYNGRKWTAHWKKKKSRLHKMVKDENGKWTKVVNTDPNTKTHFVYVKKEEWVRTYSDEDRYKKIKRMANSYVRHGDFEGYVHQIVYYVKKSSVKQ